MDTAAGAVSPSAADAGSDSPSAVDSDPPLAGDAESQSAAAAAGLLAAPVLYHTVPRALFAHRGGGPAPIDDDLPAEVLMAAAAADGPGRVDASAVTLVTQFSMDRLVSIPAARAYEFRGYFCFGVRAGPRVQHWLICIICTYARRAWEYGDEGGMYSEEELMVKQMRRRRRGRGTGLETEGRLREGGREALGGSRRERRIEGG